MAAGSLLTASEAHDADLGTLFLEILLILAILPLAHTLVVMAPLVLGAHPMRVTHVKRLHPGGTAEAHHLARPLVAQVAHPALLLAPLARPCVLQATPAFGASLTVGLQAREPPERLVVLPLEAADAAPGDDQPLACIGRYRRLRPMGRISRLPWREIAWAGHLTGMYFLGW